VGPKVSLDAVAKRKKIPALAMNRTPVVQPVACSVYFLSY